MSTGPALLARSADAAPVDQAPPAPIANAPDRASLAQPLVQPRRGLAIAAVLSAMAMVVIDGGLSNVALPRLATSLGVDRSEVILVVTAYQAAVVMMLLPSAALGERFGYRRVFTLGVAVFAAASLASALAPSLPWLLLARFVQGLGGAAVLALGVALLRVTVSDRQLGTAIGWNALTVALSAAAGPAIGATIISFADWHWLYVANVPLGLLVLAATRALPSVERQPGPIDLASILFNCAAFGFMLAGADLARTRPLLAGGLAALGLVALAALVRREQPKSRPLIPLDLLGRASFAVSILASILCFAGQTSGLIALPFLLQDGLRQTSLAAGLYMTLWPLSVALFAPLAGRALKLAGSGWICAAGAALLTLGLLAIAFWPLHDNPALLAVFLATSGAGFGLFQVANNRNMFLAAPPARSAAAGGMQGTARLIGQTTGALLVGQLFATAGHEATPRLAIAIGAALTFAAAIISLFGTRFPQTMR